MNYQTFMYIIQDIPKQSLICYKKLMFKKGIQLLVKKDLDLYKSESKWSDHIL